MSESPYRVPVGVHRATITVINSRFIATIARVTSVGEAKAFLGQIRGEMPDASHHVYAFRVGYGNSVVEGMSDDGEPSGTAGPPTLAVLRGTDVGDIILVVTRYFGGTKLGTGGLVRAYSDAARTVLESLPTELKIARQLLGIEIPYHYYDQVKRLVNKFGGIIQEETFEGNVTLFVAFPVSEVKHFSAALNELSAGRIAPVILGEV